VLRTTHQEPGLIMYCVLYILDIDYILEVEDCISGFSGGLFSTKMMSVSSGSRVLVYFIEPEPELDF